MLKQYLFFLKYLKVYRCIGGKLGDWELGIGIGMDSEKTQFDDQSGFYRSKDRLGAYNSAMGKDSLATNHDIYLL